MIFSCCCNINVIIINIKCVTIHSYITFNDSVTTNMCIATNIYITVEVSFINIYVKCCCWKINIFIINNQSNTTHICGFTSQIEFFCCNINLCWCIYIKIRCDNLIFLLNIFNLITFNCYIWIATNCCCFITNNICCNIISINFICWRTITFTLNN